MYVSVCVCVCVYVCMCGVCLLLLLPTTHAISSPLVCCRLWQVIEEEGLQANAKRVGDIFVKGMMELRDEFEIVGDVRGKGLLLGMELVEDKVRA